MALSSCESEIIALSECAKDTVYLRKKLTGIDKDYVDGPTDTSTDNKGAHDLSYNPEFHKKTKHIARRHFYVRDMVEKFELDVSLVNTDDNPADMFAKPIAAAKFFKFRDMIMNKKSKLSALAAPVSRNGVQGLFTCCVPLLPPLCFSNLLSCSLRSRSAHSRSA